MLGLRQIIPVLLLAVFCAPQGQGAMAASSEEYQSTPLTARLVTAQDGIPGDTRSLSAGLHLKLNEKWKTYWRSPGEVGIPPSVDWSGSENVEDIEFLWPAPTRFTAFGIENFGYTGNVVFPLRITLKNSGAPATLRAQVKLLVCSDICVPEEFSLGLTLENGTGIDQGAAELISTYAERVPADADTEGVRVAEAFIDDDLKELQVSIRVDAPLQSPDVFPELGAGFAMGKPDIRLGEQNRLLWARLPILAADPGSLEPPRITVTDGPDRSFTVLADRATQDLPPPYRRAATNPDTLDMVWIAAIALLGGLVLNVMPCVLPVLSIKLSSLVRHSDIPRSRVRTGFLASAAGAMGFMWGLALVLWGLQRLGMSVGWGLQFQNPLFISIMIMVLLIFSANLFGAFEFSLPSGLQTRLAGAGGREGYSADFFTGMFGAVMATPCSAPFLGTAVAFALAGRGVDILVVFTALGLGLSAPYLAVAAFPGIIAFMPRPGRWMMAIKLGMGLLLLVTALWLFRVLAGVAGERAVWAVAVFASVGILAVSIPGLRLQLKWPLTAASFVLAVVVGPYLQQPAAPQEGTKEALSWVPFDRGEIARRVSAGEVVFVDVTADWCLTCKANKALVIERDPVRTALEAESVTAMQADWTRPDARIARYLESYGRYGIPFNAVYGPAAPNGIVLSELLTSADVMDALTRAGTAALAQQGAGQD
ncbi:protein-disulfide reductase DsbD family protein [Maliponia aquimaris]|uniref:Thiol:disulfide interchange protein DsbD n=1 Tax=Maliponia aquimaris TaxID=1673631 RepID=A0A238L3S2_9RHOB|nr:protein-disulfide reductase DsbD domain-containing protein [Maliponia aquimaris]SMX49735.1 Thiol:disulfide interchange protein DsbD precursor [Maliponia aquimaris]